MTILLSVLDLTWFIAHSLLGSGTGITSITSGNTVQAFSLYLNCNVKVWCYLIMLKKATIWY